MDYYDHLIEIEEAKALLESDKPKPGNAPQLSLHRHFVLFHETRRDKTRQDKTTRQGNNMITITINKKYKLQTFEVRVDGKIRQVFCTQKQADMYAYSLSCYLEGKSQTRPQDHTTPKE
tara:strand:- start:2872 stop:3228 length:357 start_codon:yes stop_codon:yes gene_type:complete